MKILIIANEYYPYPSAITNAFNPMIEEMIRNEYKIDIITRKQRINEEKEEKINGIQVYKIEDWLHNSYDITDLQKQYKGCFFMKIANKISIIIMRASRFLDYFIKTNLKNEDGFIDKKEAIKVGKKLYRENKYDCVISLSYPFILNEIAYKIKKQNQDLRWYAYQFDPYTFNAGLDKKRYKSRIKKEKKILSKADKIFLPEENFNQNIKTSLSQLEKKYVIFPYALIRKNDKLIQKERKANEYISFVFTGTLYKEIREPERMLEFFYRLKNKGIKYKLNIYYIAAKEIEERLKSYQEKLGNNLILHARQSKEICDNAAYQADILINIGNATLNQTPSKIFENISMAKPIVNFYSIDEDTSKKQLEKYAMSLNIDTRKEYIEEDIEKFMKFCHENKDKEVSFEEATKNFKKAEEVAKEFVKIIGESHAKN